MNFIIFKKNFYKKNNLDLIKLFVEKNPDFIV